MSLRTSLVLMLLFIVLGTFAIFDPLRRAEKEEAQKDRDSHVVWLKEKKLEAIQVASKFPTVTLDCSLKDGCAFDGSGEWNLTAPAKDKADGSAVASLASTILNLTLQDKIDFETVPSEAEFGFDQPQARVALRLKGDRLPLVLKFGKAAAVGQNVYLSSSATPTRVFLVPSYLVGMVSQEVFHWRNKRLFPEAEASGMNRIGWKTKKLEVRAYRLKEKWMLEMPVSAPAGQVMLEALASTIAYTNAKSMFPAGRDSPAGKKIVSGKPELEILFTLMNGGGHKVRLFSRNPSSERAPKEYIAAIDDSNSLYVIDPVPLERFHKNLLEFRERSFIDDTARTSVGYLRFTFPKERRETVFKLVQGNWQYESGEKPRENISQERFNAFLDSLRDSSYLAFSPTKGTSEEAKAFRAQTPDLYFEIKDQGGILLAKANVALFERKLALLEKDGELRSLGEDFLKALPVRYGDLALSPNQTVVIKPEAKGASDGNSSGSEPGSRK